MRVFLNYNHGCFMCIKIVTKPEIWHTPDSYQGQSWKYVPL